MQHFTRTWHNGNVSYGYVTFMSLGGVYLAFGEGTPAVSKENMISLFHAQHLPNMFCGVCVERHDAIFGNRAGTKKAM